MPKRTTRKDPRSDPSATLEDFVRRISRIGFPAAQRIDVPIWTVSDIRWVAVEVEKFFASMKEFGWGRHDIDPLERVLQARWAAVRLAHALRHRTSNNDARAILSRLPRNAD
jgi:hypothetical protein